MLDLTTLPILVVDDNVHTCHLLLTIFRAAGASEIKTCDGPQEAFDLLPHWKPGLVLTDYRMRSMDGLEFARELRSEPKYSFLSKPIVLLTADTPNEQLVEQVKAAGIDAMVTKPIAPATLFAHMDWALTLARRRTEHAIRAAKAAHQGPPPPRALAPTWAVD